MTVSSSIMACKGMFGGRREPCMDLRISKVDDQPVPNNRIVAGATEKHLLASKRRLLDLLWTAYNQVCRCNNDLSTKSAKLLRGQTTSYKVQLQKVSYLHVNTLGNFFYTYIYPNKHSARNANTTTIIASTIVNTVFCTG